MKKILFSTCLFWTLAVILLPLTAANQSSNNIIKKDSVMVAISETDEFIQQFERKRTEVDSMLYIYKKKIAKSAHARKYIRKAKKAQRKMRKIAPIKATGIPTKLIYQPFDPNKYDFLNYNF